jgi:hypothetical protein
MKIPPLDSFSPRLPMLRGKKAELHVNISDLKAQCSVIRARMQDSPSPGTESENRLRQILGEKPVVVSLPDPEQLRTLQKELEVLNAAVSIIDTAILAETRTASNLLLEAVRPEINRLGSKFAKAFLALRSEHLEYVELVDKIDDAGGNISALRITPVGLSDPRDRSGNYSYAMREFAEAGFISKSLAPKAI